MKYFLGLLTIIFALTSCSQNKDIKTFLTNKDNFSVPTTSMPVIKDNVVYFGSFDGNFYATDANTGKEIWRFKTQKAIYSTPTINDSIVVFASYDGYLYNLDKKTGQLKWKFNIRRLREYFDYTPYLNDMNNLAASIMAFWKTPNSMGGAGRNIQNITSQKIRNFVMTQMENERGKYYVTINATTHTVSIGCNPNDEEIRKRKICPMMAVHLDTGRIDFRSDASIVTKDDFVPLWKK